MEELTGDIALAPVRRLARECELIHEVSAALDRDSLSRADHICGIVDNEHLAPMPLDQRDLLATRGGRDDGDEVQPQDLSEVCFADRGGTARCFNDRGLRADVAVAETVGEK